MRVGLYGGSFDPAHETHRAVSLLALKKLRLDAVWWLVTPGQSLEIDVGPGAAARAYGEGPRDGAPSPSDRDGCRDLAGHSVIPPTRSRG